MSAPSGGRPYEAPFDDPLDALTPAARRILAAASRLLVSEGYDALTHERVAAEAGVNKSSIRNSFGSKAALVAAVVDAMVHDGCLELSRTLAGADPQERVHGAVEGIREMIGRDAFAGYFDILPHALREPELRVRLLGLYRWWYGENRTWLGLTAGEDDDAELARLQLGVGQLVAAVIDGLSIQAALDPGTHDVSPALDALAVLLGAAAPALGGPGGSPTAADGRTAPGTRARTEAA